MVLAFESILLASFILMRQSRIARRTEERSHLELQLMLLTEKELTATLGVCREVAKRLGLRDIVEDNEINQLSEDISVDQMARKHPRKTLRKISKPPVLICTERAARPLQSPRPRYIFLPPPY